MKMPNNKGKRVARKPRQRGGTVPQSILPARQVVSMSYAHAGNLLESVARGGDFRTYALNNLFDPDFTGVGTQPVGYDQLSNVYNRFRVLKVTATFQFTGLTEGVAGIYPSSFSTLPASIYSWPSQPFGKTSLVASGAQTKRLSLSVDLWTILSLRRAEYLDDQDFAHLSTSGPARTAYLHIWCHALSGVVLNVPFSLVLNYTVEVSSPLALNVS